MTPSRAMITGELSWSWVALAFAWSGSGIWPFEASYLHEVLDRRNWDFAWCIVIGLPALGLAIAAAREWCTHRRSSSPQWTLRELDRSAMVRGRLCLALLFSWLYVLYVNLTVSTRPSSIALVAAGGAIFMAWFWLENRRVQRDCRRQDRDLRALA